MEILRYILYALSLYIALYIFLIFQRRGNLNTRLNRGFKFYVKVQRERNFGSFLR